MAGIGKFRVLSAPASTWSFRSSQHVITNPFSAIPKSFLHRSPSLVDVICKAFARGPGCRPGSIVGELPPVGRAWIHSGPSVDDSAKVVDRPKDLGKTANVLSGSGAKIKRKKLKGKREVVRWLKFFRWKRKKVYERMTAEEKIMYKLNKARKKEARLVAGLEKIEPKESSEASHDPEILTPEEHFYFLKMGLKCKNYVPVGRRGIYQGVILNMHLHWKKHQVLQVIVKTFTPEEVKEIATELARLTGGIVLDIHEQKTIIMYRGKNYTQPPTEIMSPRVTLTRRKALDKSKFLESLRNVRRFIPRLEQELKLLQTRGQHRSGTTSDAFEGIPKSVIDLLESPSPTNMSAENPTKPGLYKGKKENYMESASDSEIISDTEDLSDIFDTDAETDADETTKHPLYLDQFEQFPVENDGGSDDFEEHLRQISLEVKSAKALEKDSSTPTLDEVDHMFLRAASLLKKKRR